MSTLALTLRPVVGGALIKAQKRNFGLGRNAMGIVSDVKGHLRFVRCVGSIPMRAFPTTCKGRNAFKHALMAFTEVKITSVNLVSCHA